MYERARYYSNKFIRNAIAGFTLTGFLIYYPIKHHLQVNPVFLAFPIISFMWLFYGLKISRRLKVMESHEVQSEISSEKISFKIIERMISLLLVISMYLAFQHWKYSTFFISIVLILFLLWFNVQMKMLKKYLGS